MREWEDTLREMSTAMRRHFDAMTYRVDVAELAAPAWWEGDEEAAEESMALAKMLTARRGR